MIQFRAIIWAMGIWATAVSTLFAGLPHLQCRCPDGRIKPFCLSILIPSTCCDRSCCAGPADSHAERGNQGCRTKSCCCCEASRQAGNDSSEQVRAQGCQKTVAKAQVASRADLVRYSAQDFVSPVPDGRGWDLFVNPQPEFGRFIASLHWSPPPSDLVITLRHLLV